MKKNEEYTIISKEYKGELWSEALARIYGERKLIEVDYYTYKSIDTGEVYKFILAGHGDDAYITRVELVSNGEVKCFFQKTCEPRPIDDDKAKSEKEIEKKLLFELELASSSAILNDKWKAYKNQNSHYRKNKEKIDRIINAFKTTGFDFSRDVTVNDALKVDGLYCVLEFEKRTNNKRLYKTLETNNGMLFYLYKAKDDDAPSCLFSGLFIKCMIGEDVFESLKCCNKYKIY